MTEKYEKKYFEYYNLLVYIKDHRCFMNSKEDIENLDILLYIINSYYSALKLEKYYTPWLFSIRIQFERAFSNYILQNIVDETMRLLSDMTKGGE